MNWYNSHDGMLMGNVNSSHNPPRMLFLSLFASNYSRTEVLLDNERRENDFILVEKLTIESILHVFKKIRTKRPDGVVICSPSHILVPFVRFMTTKPIVLEAGWPISDSNFTRNHGFLAGIRAAKNFLVDLVSFHMCTKLILESLEQKKRCRNRFLLQSSKIEVVLTGVNEERFHNCSSRKPPELDKQHKPIVLFRGKYNVESGLEKILQSSFKIENDVQLVIATDRILGIECDNSKVTLIHRKLADAEIHYLYKNSVLSIGQISDHGRVNYTIPHKFFESAYFGLPYLTMQNSAVTKLTHGLGIFQLKNATSDELGNLVNSIVKSRLVLQTKSVEIANLYTRILKQSKLQESFSKIILDILK